MTTAQKQHSREKQENLSQKSGRKSYARLNKLICDGVFEIFPELKSMWDPYDEDANIIVKEKLEDIFLVLQYFSGRPQVLKSLKTGALQINKRGDI